MCFNFQNLDLKIIAIGLTALKHLYFKGYGNYNFQIPIIKSALLHAKEQQPT